MFTGLIEEAGTIRSVSRRGTMIDFTIEARSILEDVKIGDSIAVSGVCLTVTSLGDTSFSVQSVEETLKRTTLARLRAGSMVNLERSLRLGDRLGGHLVQGHIDGTGRIVSMRKLDGNAIIAIAPQPGLDRYIAEKGSITVDGISLTVTHAKKGEFGISIIPHTLKETTLGIARVGDSVNLETDIIAKYVEKLISGDRSLTLDNLKDLGF
ncbi:riboflavin synthase [Candidatus Latescibacterota bacterium]